jgi:lysine 2,3-aminomutase
LQPKYVTRIEELGELSPDERIKLRTITGHYVFRINNYYRNLIDWDNPTDAIRRLIIPSESELQEYGSLDASEEIENYVAKGCQHKYKSTAVLLVSNVCGAYCRFCFRKRLFRNTDIHEASLDISEGLEYIREHREIDNVLLTGGDSLMLSTAKIADILQQLRQIPHVRIIRMGSKLPAFNPMRIYEDQALLARLKQYSGPESRIYVMSHFNHPRELTSEAYRAIEALQSSGVVMSNQTPLLRGVNDDPLVLSELLSKLSYAGVIPYYIFQNRPVAGNYGFVVPLQKAFQVIEEAKAITSGLGKRIRFVMSHSTGKIEVLAVEGDNIYLRYHQARDERNVGRFLAMHITSDAAWFDDLTN